MRAFSWRMNQGFIGEVTCGAESPNPKDERELVRLMDNRMFREWRNGGRGSTACAKAPRQEGTWPVCGREEPVAAVLSEG